MNFELSETQSILKDSVERFIGESYSLDKRQSLVKSELGFSQDNWKKMAELGWLSITVPESTGGFGGNQIDSMIMMEEFGKGLVLEPFFISSVVAGQILCDLGNQAQKENWLPRLVSGDCQLTFAYAEEQSRFDLEDVLTRAKPDEEGGFIIDGTKSMVLHAASADAMIVSCRTSGGQYEKKGISLFFVPKDLRGIHIDSFETVDGQRAAEVRFESVRVDVNALLGEEGNAFSTIKRAQQSGILALCAEATGIMECLYKDTAAYTQDREQFDRPMSEFQVIQHRLVDMFMEYEQCKSMLLRATLEFVHNPDGSSRSIHALKYLVGKTGKFIGENAIQLHGGMGMTEELNIAHYFKRLLTIDILFGNSDYHLEKFAA